MNNTKAKTISLLCIALSCMGIIMLFFTILRISTRYYFYSATGFELLSFYSPATEDFSGILGTLSWFQLIIGISMLAYSIYNLLKPKYGIKSFVIVIVLIWTSSLLFLLEGIIASIMAKQNLPLSIVTHTTWIPFTIITALSIVTIIYIDSYKKQPTTNYQTTAQPYAPANYQTAPNTANPTLAQAIPQDDGCLFTVDGEVKLLKVYNDYVTMENKVNLRSIITHNVFGGNKKVFYQNMIGVQFKESSSLILGYIQFETANTSSKNNFNSENSVTFTHTKVPNEYVKQVVDFVERKLMESKAPVSITQATSSADELLKFKNLLDAGVISQEEFDKKKNELLSK